MQPDKLILVLLLIVFIVIICWYFYNNIQTTSTTSTTSEKNNDKKIEHLTPEISNPEMFIEAIGNNFNKIDKIYFKNFNEEEIPVEFIVINNNKLFLKTPSISGKYKVYILFKCGEKSEEIIHEIIDKS